MAASMTGQTGGGQRRVAFGIRDEPFAWSPPVAWLWLSGREQARARKKEMVASTLGRMVGLRSVLTNLMKKCVALLSGRGTGDAGPVRLLFLVEESSKLPRVIIRPIGSVLSGGGCC